MLCYIVQNVEKEPFQQTHEDSTEFSPSQRIRERDSGLYSDTKNINLHINESVGSVTKLLVQ